MNYYSIVSSDQTESVIRHLIRQFGLPTIKQDLSFYLKDRSKRAVKDRGMVQLQFLNNLSSFKYTKSDEHLKTSSSGQIFLQNRKIKYFLKFLDSINYSRGIVNEITRLDFYGVDNKQLAQCNLGSVRGDLFIFYDLPDGLMQRIRSRNRLTLMTSGEYSTLKVQPNVNEGSLFNHLGLINPKINTFMKRFGSDLLLETPCLEVKMNAMSNDYSFYEPTYKFLTGEDLMTLTSSLDEKLFKPLSIVIPSYNSNNTILKTLLSIESQNIPDPVKALLDVIIVDDGSQKSVYQAIAWDFPNLSFQPRVIRMEQNVGLSAARNAGLELSKYDSVLFIDADILLAENYLLEMSARLQAIPNAIFISLKENVERDQPLLKNKKILQGLPQPDTHRDKRMSRQLIKDQVNHHEINYDIKVEIINDTNYFRDLGFGRVIGGFDLPAMVVGHNMCIRKELVKEVGGFSNHFKGWGLEDTYFGARIIAAGNFVIPVLSTGVYHINHPPRSGSEEKRKREFSKNIKKYLELIKAPLP